MAKAKVFRSGNSEAVQLPPDFRFDENTHEVLVHRSGRALVLEPIDEDEWPADFWLAFEGEPIEIKRPEPVPQKRAPLDP